MTKFLSAVLSSALLLVLAACNQEVPSTEGELDEGNATAIAITSQVNGANDETLYLVEVALLNRNDITCGSLQSDEIDGAEYANLRAVGASISSTSPIGVGTYEVGTVSDDGSGVQSFDERSDAKCQTSVDDGSSGTITITHLDSTAVVGTFDVVFQSGAHLKGAFNAPSCALSLSTTTGTSPPPPPVCK